MHYIKLLNTFLTLIISASFLGCQTLPMPTLEEKAAQMLMIGFRGSHLKENPQIIHDIQQYKIGGVILFEYDIPSKSRPRNISSPAQLQQLCSDLQQLSKIPLLIAIDQEGGKVNRLKEHYGFINTVSQEYLGTLNDIDSTREIARQAAKQLKTMGINLNFSPCTDVNINPNCPIIGKIGRSFSSDPEIVSQQASIVIEEYRQQGVHTCIKHFPGHGSSTTDSHEGFTNISDTWQTAELIPYKELINNDICDAIMTGHLYIASKDSLYPATLSKNIVQNLLRDSLGWDGIVFSDDMTMEAITKNFGFEESIILAINAGVDILVYGNNSKSGYDAEIAQKVIQVIVQAVRDNKISEKRINESFQRIQTFKHSK